MEDDIQYEYENEESINENLKCGICNDPFTDPVETLCHHSFCWYCLNRWFENSKLTCPTCRKIISRFNSNRITLLSFISMLDQIRVTCKLCHQSNIERGNFQDHTDKICPKVTVKCSAHYIGCLWTGIREELPEHLNTCTFELTRLTSDEDNENQDQRLTEIPVNTPRNNITIFQAQIIHDIIIMHVNPSIENLSGENLTNAMREVIINNQCTHLNLFQRRISPDNLSHIALLLTNDRSLKSLELVRCSIGDTGTISFINSLPNDSCLKYLDLYNNSITDFGIQSLADKLKKTSSLIRLKLAHNQISNIGVQLLADVLVNHKTNLEQLSLVGNKLITDSCIYSIFSIIRYNRTLKILKLEDCNISYYSQNLIILCQRLYFRSDLEIFL